MQYFLEHSEDYGYSWSQYTAPTFCSSEEIKAELVDARKKSLDNGGDCRKMRFRINVVEPTRPAPELAYIDAWIAGFESGKAELLAWLSENYIGREFENMNAPVAKVEFHCSNIWIGFLDKETPPNTNVNMYHKLSELGQIKFKK
jgi:hypothetical protein